jgi:hypothetical protein
MPLRQHDVVLAEGRFQIVLTDRRRLFAVIDAPQTALGPLRIAFEIDRRARSQELALRDHLVSRDYVGGIFDDIGHAMSNAAKGVAHGVEHAAEGAFNAASKAVTTLARPVLNVVRDVTATGMHLISQHAPFLPEKTRKQIESASRIVMRARLGDLSAKQFIHGVVNAVRSGVAGARAIGDALLSGSRMVAHVLDAPFKLAEHIPAIGGAIHSLSPFQKFEQVSTAIQRGDFRGLGKIVKEDLSLAQGVISFIPGIGSGISAAISAGEAALEGGSPLEIAIHAAYGVIPIPPGVRQITDAVLDAVLALASKGAAITDAAIAASRDAVPSGLPRDVFDTLVHLVVKKNPPQKEVTALLEHYVQHFTTAGIATAPATNEDIAEIVRSTRLIQPLARLVEVPETALVLPSSPLVLP